MFGFPKGFKARLVSQTCLSVMIPGVTSSIIPAFSRMGVYTLKVFSYNRQA